MESEESPFNFSESSESSATSYSSGQEDSNLNLISNTKFAHKNHSDVLLRNTTTGKDYARSEDEDCSRGRATVLTDLLEAEEELSSIWGKPASCDERSLHSTAERSSAEIFSSSSLCNSNFSFLESLRNESSSVSSTQV